MCEVHRQCDPDDREDIPMGIRRAAGTDKLPDRLDCHDHPTCEQNTGLAERPKVLRAAVTVGVLGVRGLAAQLSA